MGKYSLASVTVMDLFSNALDKTSDAIFWLMEALERKPASIEDVEFWS
jgi:hypothetical protein